MVLDSIKLRSSNADWAAISNYRTRISPFYSNLLPSFVWLRHAFPAESIRIDLDTLISFFLLEMTISSESWRTYAAFAALTTVLQYFSSEISFDFFSLIVSACADSTRKHSTVLRPLVSDFLRFCVPQIRPTDAFASVWWGLVSILLQCANDCTPATLALLLAHPQAATVAPQFAAFIVSALNSGKLTEEEAVAFVTVLFGLAPAAIPSVIPIVCDADAVSFRLTVLRRALLRCETRVAVDRIGALCAENFAQGGFTLVAQILVCRPALGLELLARGAANEAVRMIEESFEQARLALQFLALALMQARHEARRAEIAAAAGRAAIRALAKWGGDRRRGREIAGDAVRIVRDADAVAAGAGRRALGISPQEEREKCVAVLGRCVAAGKPHSQKLALKKFSSTKRKVHADEDGWQAIELED